MKFCQPLWQNFKGGSLHEWFGIPPGQNSREKSQNAQNEMPEGQGAKSSAVAEVLVEWGSKLYPLRTCQP
jgi:hypothetical protein